MIRPFFRLVPPICVAIVLLGRTTAAVAERRQVISLDGTWQIAEGMRDRMPSRFNHQILVPGLADMAQPRFENVGNEKSHQYRQAFWYRRSFTIADPYPEAVRLKLHKAMYGTRRLSERPVPGRASAVLYAGGVRHPQFSQPARTG